MHRAHDRCVLHGAAHAGAPPAAVHARQLATHRSLAHTGELQPPSTLAWVLNLTREALPDDVSPTVGAFTIAAAAGGSLANATFNATGGACSLLHTCGPHLAPGVHATCNFSCTPGTTAASVAVVLGDDRSLPTNESAAQVLAWRAHDQCRGWCRLLETTARLAVRLDCNQHPSPDAHPCALSLPSLTTGQETVVDAPSKCASASAPMLLGLNATLANGSAWQEGATYCGSAHMQLTAPAPSPQASDCACLPGPVRGSLRSAGHAGCLALQPNGREVGIACLPPDGPLHLS